MGGVMMDTRSTPATTFLEEHCDLAVALDQVGRTLKRVDRRRASIVRQLNELVDHVESHFAHEEDGGYMAESLARAPRLATRAGRLLAEHAELLDDVHKLQMLARSGVETDGWWRQIETDCERLKVTLFVHEHAEHRLVQEAFNRDIGVAG
jgi:hypothetical protein